MRTYYRATQNMCYSELAYGTDKLSASWVGKRFYFDPDRVVGTAFLHDDEDDTARAWRITPELIDRIQQRDLDLYSKEELAAENRELRDNTVSKEKYDSAVKELSEGTVPKDRYDAAVENLKELKAKVIEVAMEYAERYDWCSTVQEALEEMGLEVPKKEYVMALSVTYRVTGTKEDHGEPDTWRMEQDLYLDADISASIEGWMDVEVEYVTHDIVDIEEVRG